MPDSSGFIFDMDGVIVHSNPAHKKAIQIFCDKYHLNVSDTLLEEKVYGRTNKEWIPEVFGEISSEKLKTLADEKEQLFRDLFVPEDHIVPGILSFLETLRERRFPMAIATSAPVENADYILSRLSIKGHFDALLDSSHVTTGKPNPEVYFKAAKALDREPGQCIIFEDSIAGVQAGISAGATVVGVTTTHAKEEFPDCPLVINDFEAVTPDDLLSLV
ncbi:HAD family hydrolase [Fodinibius sediminis]|uniref:Haloacid dehalogenase superfamily, subfamily IA, variant 3 with third motif having DD or ED n=1 Tax=Fodinibius sediminis TaxID=1214077 RepID=A0A521DRN0_9BACT|nr:HAD family phosphatase [Fodinibius sediminis]SMO73791.1 haloacid dehalogenase superfamily, subfamily IA, variant 3 with third motif having DD or ED [Fodinibius sediminis]